jgi:hypothetical protein
MQHGLCHHPPPAITCRIVKGATATDPFTWDLHVERIATRPHRPAWSIGAPNRASPDNSQRQHMCKQSRIMAPNTNARRLRELDKHQKPKAGTSGWSNSVAKSSLSSPYGRTRQDTLCPVPNASVAVAIAYAGLHRREATPASSGRGGHDDHGTQPQGSWLVSAQRKMAASPTTQRHSPSAFVTARNPMHLRAVESCALGAGRGPRLRPCAT